MNPLDHPGTNQIPNNDVEKLGEESAEINVTGAGSDTSLDPTKNYPFFDSSNQHDIPPPVALNGRLAYWNAKVEGLAGLEARGITRVLPEEKHGGGRRGYQQMFALWFSISMAATSIITGLLGPLVFQLGWVDCVCIIIFAIALASCPVSYISTFGPQSGNRTMVRIQADDIPRNRWSSEASLALLIPSSIDAWLTSIADVCTAYSIDPRSIFHGLLAFKDCLHPQSNQFNGLGNHRMHCLRPDVFGCQWRRHEYRCWLRC